MRFEWDERKNLGNRAKHGVGFTLAAQIFGDPLLQTVQDHAIDSEERWNSTGSTPKGNLLFVVHNVWSEE